MNRDITYVSLIGCGCSPATIPIAEISHYWNVPHASLLEESNNYAYSSMRIFNFSFIDLWFLYFIEMCIILKCFVVGLGIFNINVYSFI